jgi:hypothetical protein
MTGARHERPQRTRDTAGHGANIATGRLIQPAFRPSGTCDALDFCF